MASPKLQTSVWDLAAAQHGVVSRAQLLDLGYSPVAIRHRVRKGRLHVMWPNVYAVGRPIVTRHGLWLAAAMSCGPSAAVSHASAGALLGLRAEGTRRIELSVPARVNCRRRGVRIHRRVHFETTIHDGIPVTTPVATIVDLSTRLPPNEIEAAINAADKLDLTNPLALRQALDPLKNRPGVEKLRKTLDERTFVLTESELERLLLPIARRAGLPKPLTGVYVNGFKVDFYWPELGLVVEADGVRFHRTAAEQRRDRQRDHAHTAAGLTVLRFTHGQIAFEPAYVEEILARVAR